MPERPKTVQAVVTLPLIDGDKIQAKHARAVLGCSTQQMVNFYKRGFLTPHKRGRRTYVLWSEVRRIERTPSRQFTLRDAVPA